MSEFSVIWFCLRKYINMLLIDPLSILFFLFSIGSVYYNEVYKTRATGQDFMFCLKMFRRFVKLIKLFAYMYCIDSVFNKSMLS